MSNGLSRNVARSTMVWIGLFFVLALTLRIAFNVGPAFDEEQERWLYSGNDPWYHDRTVEHIVETGESLTYDGAIKYPFGANNPNPPVYDWTTAVDAKILDMAGAPDAVGLALNLAVAFWGALTVIPVFMIGNAMWGRKAGLWAAFFMAVSAPHIQRSVFGFADHDAATMFFITLAFAFLLKALKGLRAGEYISSWKTLDAIWAGKKKVFTTHKQPLLWSALAGVALAATALTWKGYPYALAIIAVAFGFQLLRDHTKNKDSTPVVLVYLIPVVLTLLLSLPYYAALGLTASTVMPNLYVLLGMLVVGLILAPTRELPSILVFPALALAGLIGVALMLWVFPDVGRTVFTGLGYFQQTKLYTTIAEAQRTELGFVAANFGFFTFLLIFWAYAKAVRKAWRGDVAFMLLASWATVAGFMAFAASRFVMNAAPVFVVLIGAAVGWIMDKAGLDDMARRQNALHGQGSPVGRFFKSLSGRSIGVTLGVLVLLVLPNVWVGVDAAMSSDYVQENELDPQYWGAFGIGFDLKDNGWLGLFDELATLDQDVPLEERPGFIAWWDYGHWATSIGQHPTVADPFQNNHEIAGRFLASESEEEAALWLAILAANEDARGGMSDAVSAVFTAHGMDAAAYGGDFDDKYTLVSENVDDAFAFYDDLVDATGDDIRYLGVDSRMYPLSASQSGIFYAPVFLANKNPDEFIGITYSGQGLQLTLEQYGIDENGDSYRFTEPRFVDQSGEDWIVLGDGRGGGTAYPGDTSPYALGSTGGIQVQSNLALTQRFADAMYTRAFGHILAAQAPGDGLAHWRAIYEDTRSQSGTEIRTTALLEYFRGVPVSGTVLDGDGAPMMGVSVTFVDGFGAAHGSAMTDASGAFEVLAPFGDDLELTVRAAGVDLYSMEYDVTRDEAMAGVPETVTVTVPKATLGGRVYRDLDGDGAFSEGDDLLAGAMVSGPVTVTTGADGAFDMGSVTAGAHVLVATLDGFENATVSVTPAGGEDLQQDIAMTPIESTVTVSFTDAGAPVDAVPVRFEGPEMVTVTTDLDGTAQVELEPGTYTVTVDHTFTQDGNEVVYSVTETFTVAFGGADQTLDLQA